LAPHAARAPSAAKAISAAPRFTDRRLAEALRANLRKRKAQTREARTHDEKSGDALKD
jgi:hypothetical protein